MAITNKKRLCLVYSTIGLGMVVIGIVIYCVKFRYVRDVSNWDSRSARMASQHVRMKTRSWLKESKRNKVDYEDLRKWERALLAAIENYIEEHTHFERSRPPTGFKFDHSRGPVQRYLHTSSGGHVILRMIEGKEDIIILVESFNRKNELIASHGILVSDPLNEKTTMARWRVNRFGGASLDVVY